MKELDDDGYPTEEALEVIRKWDFADETNHEIHNLLDFVQRLWSYPDRFCWYSTAYSKEYTKPDMSGKYKVKYRKLYLSTGGWSGNESVIDALQDNFMFWAMCWAKTERGGHYWFEIPEIKKPLVKEG